ncbi:MAG: carbohydrate kinase family protein [Anaerolineaceae bacterium]|nr:carbohydrate kinase family protein [Anaerolineaceae bacterium]
MTMIITGSVAFDYLMTFPGYFRDHILPERLDTISLSFLVDSMVRQRGGTAPNIAYTLALLGERPALMATAGEDFDEYRAWLDQAGIDTTYTKVIPGVYTASFFANTDLANSQISSFYTGAMAYAADLSIHDTHAGRADYVVISPNDPTAMDRYVKECRESGIPYLYDPSQQVVRMDAQQLRRGVEGAHSVFVNEYEHELLQKHTGLTTEDILQCVRILAVTCGAQGAKLYVDGREYQIPSVEPMQILDPTGVGDAFRGGFLRGFGLGLDWQTCGQMGSLAATYCLEQRGTQAHTYTPGQFIARYRSFFDDQGALDALLSES